MSVDGQNLRVHPTLGATAVDRPLAYRDGDPNAGRRPRVTAAAYTNAVAGAATTKLFVIVPSDLEALIAYPRSL